jgi:hypothetical protein
VICSSGKIGLILLVPPPQPSFGGAQSASLDVQLHIRESIITNGTYGFRTAALRLPEMTSWAAHRRTTTSEQPRHMLSRHSLRLSAGVALFGWHMPAWWLNVTRCH